MINIALHLTVFLCVRSMAMAKKLYNSEYVHEITVFYHTACR